MNNLKILCITPIKHIPNVENSLEELGLHCEDMHVLGVFISDKFRQK